MGLSSGLVAHAPLSTLPCTDFYESFKCNEVIFTVNYAFTMPAAYNSHL